MSMSVDGLISGLNTTEFIDSLMQVEAIPQALLKNKSKGVQTMVQALQALNTKVAALADLAAKSAKAGALDLSKATSSSETLTATAKAGATPGSIDIVVDRVAQRQVTVTEAATEWAGTEFTIVGADGVPTTITAASASLDDVVTAINGSDAGVSAIKVAAGTDPATGAALYRLQLTSTEDGAAGAFTLEGTAVGTTQIRAAQDAQVTLWAGTAAAQSVTSSTNGFTDLLPGLDVTVSKASETPITVDIVRDDERITETAEELVASLADLFAFINTNTQVNTSTGADGSQSTSGGIFTGDSMVRGLTRRIMDAATAPIDGRSPSEIGISITEKGTVEFDAEKFAAALADDPVRVEHVLQTIASRVETVTDEASDSYDGEITLRIQGQESLVKTLGDQILAWDNRLATRRATLERTYAALEVQLSNLNAQSSWLASQLTTLSTTGSTSK